MWRYGSCGGQKKNDCYLDTSLFWTQQSVSKMWRAFPWIERPRNSKQKIGSRPVYITTTSYQWAGWVMVWSFEVWCTLWSFLFFSLLFGQVAGSFFPGRNNLIMACQAPVATFSCANVHHNCVLTIDDRLTDTVVNFHQKSWSKISLFQYGLVNFSKSVILLYWPFNHDRSKWITVNSNHRSSI